MTITRREATAEALARSFAAALKPGPHGKPIIDGWKGSSFIVRGEQSGERYLVTVTALDAAGEQA